MPLAHREAMGDQQGGALPVAWANLLLEYRAVGLVGNQQEDHISPRYGIANRQNLVTIGQCHASILIVDIPDAQVNPTIA
ncbi:hypothetical protein D3C78_1687140 [compost metagenome]